MHVKRKTGQRTPPRGQHRWPLGPEFCEAENDSETGRAEAGLLLTYVGRQLSETAAAEKQN